MKCRNEIVSNTLQNNAASFLFYVRRARTTKQKRITNSRGATLVELQNSKIVKIALRFTSNLNDLFFDGLEALQADEQELLQNLSKINEN